MGGGGLRGFVCGLFYVYTDEMDEGKEKMFPYLITVLLFTSYRSCGGIPCLRSTGIMRRATRRRGLCSTGVVPGSLLAVMISYADPRLTIPFGLAMTARGGMTVADAASRPVLRRCLMSGSKGVGFPMLNRLEMNNLAGGRTRRLVIRGLGPCVGRAPVIAIHVMGCGVSMLNRITHPKAFAVDGRGIGLLRTLTVTNSVAI